MLIGGVGFGSEVLVSKICERGEGCAAVEECPEQSSVVV